MRARLDSWGWIRFACRDISHSPVSGGDFKTLAPSRAVPEHSSRDGIHWWMRLRRDTIRIEESASCFGRLSLYRLPAKRWRALYHVGISAPQGSAGYEG